MTPERYDVCMPRVSVSPRRNLDAPLVPVDQDVAWHVRFAQRIFGAYVWALIAYFIIGTPMAAAGADRRRSAGCPGVDASCWASVPE
jgi:hypothetical protein